MKDFKNFKTNKYWSQSLDKIAQKFYIILCLYTSAALDFGVGLYLKDNKILNWSVTSSYYSILHSARMVIFASVGDYMTGHSIISSLFSLKSSTGRAKQFSTDWLNKFEKNFDKDIAGEETKFTSNELYNYYKNKLHLEEPSETFNCIGKILGNAKDLRNNSNYEALLIAHEYNHAVVTDYFEKLSKLMSNSAEICLKCATKCLKSYIESDIDLNEGKNDFKYFLKEHIKNRIYSPIKSKIRKSYILKKIKDCVEPLERICAEQDKITLISFNIIDQVSMEMFSGKKRLMRSFNDEIEKLRKNIESKECKIYK